MTFVNLEDAIAHVGEARVAFGRSGVAVCGDVWGAALSYRLVIVARVCCT